MADDTNAAATEPAKKEETGFFAWLNKTPTHEEAEKVAAYFVLGITGTIGIMCLAVPAVGLMTAASIGMLYLAEKAMDRAFPQPEGEPKRPGLVSGIWGELKKNFSIVKSDLASRFGGTKAVLADAPPAEAAPATSTLGTKTAAADFGAAVTPEAAPTALVPAVQPSADKKAPTV